VNRAKFPNKSALSGWHNLAHSAIAIRICSAFADCSALVLEGSGPDAEKWAGTQGSTHGAAEGRAQGASAPKIRWCSATRMGNPSRSQPSKRRSASAASGRASEHRLARAPAHLLLAPRHEGRGAEGDSGARGSLDAEHDPSVHASSAERALRSDWFAQLWAAGGQRSERSG
jgi:hypothetical protein